MTTIPLYTYKLLNSQNQLEIGLLNHLAQQVAWFLYLISNFPARFLRSTLGRLKEKYDWQDLTILISPVLSIEYWQKNLKLQLSPGLRHPPRKRAGSIPGHKMYNIILLTYFYGTHNGTDVTVTCAFQSSSNERLTATSYIFRNEKKELT